MRLNGWLVLGILLGTALYAVAEELTLTTYYPSPRGVYRELRTTGNVAIGTVGPAQARLHVIRPNDLTPAVRVDDNVFSGTDETPFLIDSEGNVGIGTSVPAAALDVVGQVKISGGNPGLGKVLSSDANGLASWKPAGGPGTPVAYATSALNQPGCGPVTYFQLPNCRGIGINGFELIEVEEWDPLNVMGNAKKFTARSTIQTGGTCSCVNFDRPQTFPRASCNTGYRLVISQRFYSAYVNAAWKQMWCIRQ
ncbi:MAG: hypothetical protein HYY15_04495 [Candidatus Omnitrophica bacterium]|nr:hypothetical protein [Candidatus Omnitrophota bacterium]